MDVEAETGSRAPASLPLHISLIARSAHPADVAARLVWWSLAVWLFTRMLDVLVTVGTTTGELATKLSHWYFWDAGFYMSIAVYGYVPSDPRLAAYFPLYPLLAHVLILAHLPAAAALLIIANTATLASFVSVGLLVWHETRQEGAAIWALIALAVSPLGVFLSGMYSDSLFIVLAASALLAARSWHWGWASIALALAIITRPFGVALAVALAVEYARQRAWSINAIRRNWREVAMLLGAPALTIGAFLGLMWRQYGDALITLRVERIAFGHAFSWPWQTIFIATRQFASTLPHATYPTLHMSLDLIPIVLCFVYVVWAAVARQAPLAFVVYVATIVLLCLTSPVMNAGGDQYAIISDGRYCYAALPLLIPTGRFLAHRPATSVLLGVSLLAQVALVSFVLHGGWLV